MYFLPHLYETENYQVTIAPIELEEFDHATMHPADVCSYNLRTLPRHLKFVFCCFSLLSERKYRFT